MKYVYKAHKITIYYYENEYYSSRNVQILSYTTLSLRETDNLPKNLKF